jgi:chemotaxis protein MotB
MQSTYDGLVNQLKGEVSSGNVTIQQIRDGIRVNLAQDILFKSGSANLDKSGKEVLAKVAEELKSSTYEIAVIGHTDNQKIGPGLAQRYPTNWELGSARASQITRLFMDAGIAESRMLAVSAADGRPRADNATEEGRAQNRRIEIRLRPGRDLRGGIDFELIRRDSGAAGPHGPAAPRFGPNARAARRVPASGSS